MRHVRLAALSAAALAVIAVIALIVPRGGGAQAPVGPPTITLSSADGWIAAAVTGPAGATAAIAEQTPSQTTPVTSVALPAGSATVEHLAAWSCATERTFVVSTPGAAGAAQTATATVRTPSCAKRLTLAVSPSRPRSGGSLAVKVTDTWKVGDVSARVCAKPPTGRATCRTAKLAAGRSADSVAFDLRRGGTWTVSLKTADQSTSRTVRVARPGPLRLLATGDSMIQIIDSDLAARLKRGTVISDARISTGISKPFMLDWVAHAKQQVAARHPDATVVFLGANDGFAIGDANCCGSAWIDGYARRVREMMDTYGQGGRAHVYWMLLPAPGKPSFARVFTAVNAAIRKAAKGAGPNVGLIDVGRVVAPGGHFRASITYRGHSVTVRQDDQVHLSIAGAAIAADLIVQALEDDGLA
jgi:lysophospholipase L1-like esterase